MKLWVHIKAHVKLTKRYYLLTTTTNTTITTEAIGNDYEHAELNHNKLYACRLSKERISNFSGVDFEGDVESTKSNYMPTTATDTTITTTVTTATTTTEAIRNDFYCDNIANFYRNNNYH